VRRARRGLNLVEVVVAIAIALGLLTLGGMFFQNLSGAKEYSAVKTFVGQVKLAQQQATIENRVYRIAFELDLGTYSIEAGDAEALTFRDAEQRIEAEKKVADSMGSKKGEDELQKLIACARARQEDPNRSCGEIDELDPDQALAMLEAESGEGFAAVNDQFFSATVELPASVRLNGVYTPAYGEYQRPSDDDDIDEEDRVRAFTHIFPGGMTEHTVVQFVREGYDDFGYTVELEPLSGKITVDTVVRDWDEREYEIPDEGPELDS
jgi:type II secretory pathway pseudopilin PulG